MAARAETTIPLADAPSLWTWARRTSLLRTLLAFVAAALFGLALAAAFTLKTRATSYFGTGSGVVVSDMSKSIDPRAYQRMARVLTTLANSGQRLGFVAFSDSPYELLPPGTNGDEMRPLLRYFETGPNSTDVLTRQTPWSKAFFGGTSIGRALTLAREMIEQDRFRSRSALLISDLQDASPDRPILVSEISRYADEGIQLRVVPLFPPPEALAYFSSIAGPQAIISRGELLHNSKLAEKQTVIGSFPWWLFLLGGALLAVVAVNERVCRRLQWSRE